MKIYLFVFSDDQDNLPVLAGITEARYLGVHSELSDFRW